MRRRAPVGQRRALGGRGGAGIDQFLQLLQRLGRRRQRGRLKRFAHQGEQPRIDPVGLGQQPQALANSRARSGSTTATAKPAACRRTLRRAMVLAGRLHHDPRHAERGELAVEASPAAAVVGDAKASAELDGT